MRKSPSAQGGQKKGARYEECLAAAESGAGPTARGNLSVMGCYCQYAFEGMEAIYPCADGERAIRGPDVEAFRRSVSLVGFHDPQDGTAIDILEWEVDQVGVRVHANCVRVRHV